LPLKAATHHDDAMTTMIAEVYNAFRKAGVADVDAEAAAAAVLPAAEAASKQDMALLRTEMAELRTTGLKHDLAGLRAETKLDLAELRVELVRMMWLQAGVIIGALSLVFGGIATLVKVL
jgi:hypothetical protein